MKLIKQTILHFQDAKSDKVYEVDLCDMGGDLYVVNFRYGRRGSKLKDGTKTEHPVPLNQAEKVFAKLVNEKTGKGYQDVSVPTPITPDPLPQVSNINVPNPHHQAIINRLAGAGNNKWPLDRAIWRAGELQIREALPLILSLLGTGEPLRDYCIAWALGWCANPALNSEENEAIKSLNKLVDDPNTPSFISRIAWEAVFKLSPREKQIELRDQKLDQLPPQLKELALNGTVENFTISVQDYLNTQDYKKFAILDTLYQIDNPITRPTLIQILRTAPLKPNYFKSMRHIFKMAEYRQDAEIFGILTYRFEKEPGMYKKHSYSFSVNIPDVGSFQQFEYRQNPETRRWESIRSKELEKEMSKPDSRIAYNTNTKEYLRRRVWRTLKTLAELEDPNYVKMATGILLQYSDGDSQGIKQSKFYRWDRTTWKRYEITHNWDEFSAYLILNHILYENSPRYILKPNGSAWDCRDNYQAGDPEPEVREEAFPHLWEQQPDALLELLLGSNCRIVHHFAVKVLNICHQFVSEIETNTIIQLLQKKYPVTAKFAWQLAQNKYVVNNPDLDLVLAVVNCEDEEGRLMGYRWIEAQRKVFINDSFFVLNLVTSKHSQTRKFAGRLLSLTPLNDQTAKLLIGLIISQLLGSNTDQETAKDVCEILLVCFTPQLRNLGMGIILDLLRHPLPELQELGARILLNHETPAINLPPELIESLIESPYENIRVVGIRIFGNLPEAMLINEKRSIILAMTVSSIPDIRQSIQPIIRDLATKYPEFAASIATELINILLLPERHEGIHNYLLGLLRSDLPEWQQEVSKETGLKLTRSNSPIAQELGGLVLSANHAKWSAEFTTIDIVKLANHEIFTIREAAQKMFRDNLDRFHSSEEEMLAAVRLLEAKWEDSRQFAQEIFTNEFSLEEWRPQVMIAICDSIKEDVRQFGKNLVTRTFQTSYGQDYLLKFSEHPSADMQLFATNYLVDYAENNLTRLRELIPYFITILSGVNRGRVAKQRIFSFLNQEVEKSEPAAQIVAEILTRQSLTIVKQDKANAIEIMLKIKQLYPHINLPIKVIPA